MTTADLRLVLLLPLVVGTLLIFTTCNDAPTVAPDDTSIRAAPGGNPGKPPKDGDGVGAQDLDYEIVVSPIRQFTQAPEFAVMRQACPDGKVAIGGGYDFERGSQWNILAEQIASSGAGLPNDEWQVSIEKGQGEALDAQIFVVCING